MQTLIKNIRNNLEIISQNPTMNHFLGLGNEAEIFASSHKSSTENQGLIIVMIYHKQRSFCQQCPFLD